jgi:hypothetical protein
MHSPEVKAKIFPIVKKKLIKAKDNVSTTNKDREIYEDDPLKWLFKTSGGKYGKK